MILGMELALTILGLLMLVRGRPLAKSAAPHPHYRWLGAFCVGVWVPVLLAMVVAGVVIAIRNPGVDPASLQTTYRWPLMGLEAAIVVAWGVAAIVWEQRIRRKTVGMGTA